MRFLKVLLDERLGVSLFGLERLLVRIIVLLVVEGQNLNLLLSWELLLKRLMNAVTGWN